jgi:hypothetical protein
MVSRLAVSVLDHPSAAADTSFESPAGDLVAFAGNFPGTHDTKIDVGSLGQTQEVAGDAVA